VITLGVAISVSAAAVLIPKLVNPAHAATSSTDQAVTTGLTPAPKNLDLHALRIMADHRSCVEIPVSRCRLVNGTGRKVLLIGDSDAGATTPLFAEVARRENLKLWVTTATDCPWQRRLYTELEFTACKRWNDDLYRRVIREVDPDVIILLNLAYGHKGNYRPYVDADHKRVDFGTVSSETISSIAALRAGGRDFVIIEPLPLPVDPNPDFNPLACLSSAKVVEQCRYRTDSSPSRLELLYRSIARHDRNVRSLDLDREVCPLFPVCDPIIGGVVVKWDQQHVTNAFSLTLVPEMDTYLKSVGFIPR